MAYVEFACTPAPTNYPGIYTGTVAVLDHILTLTPGLQPVPLPLPKSLTTLVDFNSVKTNYLQTHVWSLYLNSGCTVSEDNPCF